MKKFFALVFASLIISACSKPQLPKTAEVSTEAKSIMVKASSSKLSANDKNKIMSEINNGINTLHYRYVNALKNMTDLSLAKTDSSLYPRDGEDYKFLNSLSQTVAKDYSDGLKSFEEVFSSKISAALQKNDTGAEVKSLTEVEEADYSARADGWVKDYASVFDSLLKFYSLKDREEKYVSEENAKTGVAMGAFLKPWQDDLRRLIGMETNNLYMVREEELQHKFSPEYKTLRSRSALVFRQLQDKAIREMHVVSLGYLQQAASSSLLSDLYKKYDSAKVDGQVVDINREIEKIYQISYDGKRNAELANFKAIINNKLKAFPVGAAAASSTASAAAAPAPAAQPLKTPEAEDSSSAE